MAVVAEPGVDLEPLDASDVDRWVGKPLGGNQLKYPITELDIKRWAQGMQNPNPLHFNDGFAQTSAFRRLVAPQSFAVCTDTSHGASPAIQGTIPGSHMLFGGDEWWFFGRNIEPGDHMRSIRMAYDYKVTNTRFAGPTMFQRGDTTYVNQRGEPVAKQRSTSIRYSAANARKLAMMKDQEREPVWDESALAAVEHEQLAYYRALQDHNLRTLDDVRVDEKLPARPIGPHTLASFSTEWRSYIMTVWGSSSYDGLPTSTDQAGWLPQMSRNVEAAKLDPGHSDGLYHGASRGHVQEQYARLIGMPRAYGYGASMGAWVLDYVANWAGELGYIVHTNIQYRNPAFAGDVTYLNGSVTAVSGDTSSGEGIVTVLVEMTTQDGTLMARGPAEVRFPARR
jgi:acyl dehydratase